MTETKEIAVREEWLIQAADHLRREVFAPNDVEVPPFRVSVGWPGGRGSHVSTIGQCWATAASEDKLPQVFISPVLKDPVEVLRCLLHEMIHAWDDCQSGHRGAFLKTFRAVGMTGKATECLAGEELTVQLEEIVEKVGKYPHGRMKRPGEIAAGPGIPKKQTNRQLLLLCETGVTEGRKKKSIYKVRTTRQWIDEVGTPLCPCHNEPMVEDSDA